jgi:thiamine pyrophosphate-dependent acetolactate synthase large subunit-like protein
MKRRDVVRALLHDRGDVLVVAGLGAPAWDITAAGDHPLSFPMWGAMGGAAMVGLGLALSQPERRVVVITGDGEMLMALGALATIAVQQPRNLSIVVLDNERYGETGMQKTHTAYGVNLAKIAKAAGFPSASVVGTIIGVRRLRRQLFTAHCPLFAVAKVRADKPPLVLPPTDGAMLKDRFRSALLGAAPIQARKRK